MLDKPNLFLCSAISESMKRDYGTYGNKRNKREKRKKALFRLLRATIGEVCSDM
jgi:transposase